jgi:hypothetical protein
MVQRYYADVITTESEGTLVLHSDYLKLKEALREALGAWEQAKYDAARGTPMRLIELRKEFDL